MNINKNLLLSYKCLDIPHIYANNNNLNKKQKNINFYKLLFILQPRSVKGFTSYTSYQTFNLLYLQNIYKISLKEKNINSVNVLPKKLIKNILFKTRYTSYKKFNIKYFNEIVYMFVVNIFLKNSKNVCKYIKKN